MKKKILLTIVFAFILMIGGYTISNAASYETSRFKINIPDKYKNVETGYNTIKVPAQYVNSSDIVSISIKSDYNTGKTIEADQTLLNALVRTFRNEIGYGFYLIDSQLVESNNCKGAEIKFWNIERGIVLYSNVYMYCSDNYIHNVVIISSSRSYLSSLEKQQIMNSFKVKDTVKVSNGIPFMDVGRNDWYYNSVKYVSNKKIITGTTEYTFNPNGNLKRGMLATIIWRMEGMPSTTNGKNFPDVKSGEYYYNAVKWASSKGIVNGYSNGTFGPGKDITREQLAVILNNYIKYKKKNNSKLANISGYKDSKSVSSYAMEAIKWAIGNKIISGKENGTKIAPQGKATRAEAAAMIESFCSLL